MLAVRYNNEGYSVKTTNLMKFTDKLNHSAV